MKFREFEEEVGGLVANATKDLGHDADPEVGLPPNPSYGDLSSPVAIRIASKEGKKPAETALRLADRITASVGKTSYVSSVTAHPGGYLNFTLKFPQFMLDSIGEIAGSDEPGSSAPTGASIAVEHTNVNPNKALHVGHARNLVMGDSLVRILRHAGNTVQALNYIDDSGAQVADVIVGFKFLGMSDDPPAGTKFDAYCGDVVYSKVNSEYAKDPKLKEKQSLVLKEIERGKGEVAEYTRKIVDRILAAQLSTCWRIGASYDLLNWESQIVHSGMWENVFEKLKRDDYVKLETEGENKGCWVIPDSETGEQKVVVRSDGTTVYVAKDIPYAAWKIGLVEDPFGYEVYEGRQPDGRALYTSRLEKSKVKINFGSADLAISVIDTRQSYLQRIVSKVLDKLQAGASKRYRHRSYEVVALSKKTAEQLGFEISGDFAQMSGRKGLYVNVDSVLAALKERAETETRKRNTTESEDWVQDVAEAVAVAAFRYELLKQDPDKMIVFDIEDSIRFDGDTGPYLLYTYARARRILAKSTGRPSIDIASASKLTKREELALGKKMSMLDIAVGTASEYFSPKEIARYSHELAVAINDYYENVQVNREEDEALRDARLALVDASSKVLAQGLRLMGIGYRDRI
ncbi:MAG: arginine--tRNA ligase [Thaumarchaeota archaeon]|nr:arginine--tRNA ligase [Nitrososphaerota archaeon]